MFAQPVPVRLGEVVLRDGFVFADLLAETDSTQRPQRAQSPQRMTRR
jgi:hypothetical protein